MYIGTYHEEGKPPMVIMVSDEYKPEDKERLLAIAKQRFQRGYWTNEKVELNEN
jgi:hypothetical protein